MDKANLANWQEHRQEYFMLCWEISFKDSYFQSVALERIPLESEQIGK